MVREYIRPWMPPRGPVEEGKNLYGYKSSSSGSIEMDRLGVNLPVLL